MVWLIVVFAGVLEIVWAVGLRYTDGFTRLWPSVGTMLVMGVSFFLLTLPTGTVYAVWVGIGAVGTAMVGVLFLGEPASFPRIASILLIILGIIGLKLSS